MWSSTYVRHLFTFMETGLQEIWEIKAREVLKEKYRAQVRNGREKP